MPKMRPAGQADWRGPAHESERTMNNRLHNRLPRGTRRALDAGDLAILNALLQPLLDAQPPFRDGAAASDVVRASLIRHWYRSAISHDAFMGLAAAFAGHKRDAWEAAWKKIAGQVDSPAARHAVMQCQSLLVFHDIYINDGRIFVQEVI